MILRAIALVAPLLGQCALLIVLLVHGNWTFAAVSATALLSSLAWALLRSVDGRNQKRPDTAATSGMPTHRAPTVDEPPPPSSPPLEELLSFDENPRLWWRDVMARWASNNDPESTSLTATMGVSDSGGLTIDLGVHGPHALVCGTTGSGKSVVLRTWCLSLACRYPPSRLHFVFLDFKGGAGLDALAELPHAVGNVCDLDLRHAKRALRALERELTRRERLVSRHRVSDVRHLPMPPPTMVVVVDEFHALRGRLPGYIDRLTTIASLGRSLGMHLIACTQNPQGQVGADMKANLSLHVCLRVRDAFQSVEMLGDGRAARISPRAPGMGYLDNGEDVTRFHCAAARSSTALVSAIRVAAAVTGSPPRPQLFSPPLPSSINLERIPHPVGARSDSGEPQSHLARPPSIVVGVCDDGTRVSPMRLSLDGGNIMVVGSPGCGKTTLLDTMIESIRQWSLTRHAAAASRTPQVMVLALAGHGGDPDTMRHHAATVMSRADDAVGHRFPSTPNDRRTSDTTPDIMLVDDADPLLAPLSSDPLAKKVAAASHNPRCTVVAAVSRPERCRLDDVSWTIIFPTGDRTTDLMHGIPSVLLDDLDSEDCSTPGRAAIIRRGMACMVQCAVPREFTLGKTLEKSRD